MKKIDKKVKKEKNKKFSFSTKFNEINKVVGEKLSFDNIYHNASNNELTNSFNEQNLKIILSGIYKFFIISDILILTFMFFASIFLNAKTGYYLNFIQFDQYNSLFIPGVIFGLLSFLLYIPNISYSIAIFVKLFIMKKNFKNLNFYVHSLLNILNLFVIVVSLISIFLDYKLIFIAEIVMIFHFLIIFYLKIDEKYEMNFTFIKKLNEKILSKNINFSVKKSNFSFRKNKSKSKNNNI